MGINVPEEAKENLKNPSESIQIVLMSRLAEMTKEELSMLDSAITPQVAKVLMKLLPELEMLINAVQKEGGGEKMEEEKMEEDMPKEMGALGANVMIIRRANVGDISRIIFLLQMMHEETVVDIPKINTGKLVHKINELLHTGIILVAVDNEKVIGSISGQKNKDWWSDEDYIGDLWYYVMKDYRKSDIAKKLLNHFVKIVKEVKLQLRLDMFFLRRCCS